MVLLSKPLVDLAIWLLGSCIKTPTPVFQGLVCPSFHQPRIISIRQSKSPSIQKRHPMCQALYTPKPDLQARGELQAISHRRSTSILQSSRELRSKPHKSRKISWHILQTTRKPRQALIQASHTAETFGVLARNPPPCDAIPTPRNPS